MATSLINSLVNLDDENTQRIWIEQLRQALTIEDWTDATLLGAWVTAGGRTVQYYKDPFGVVHIRGAATGGTGDVFELPEGYRPTQAGYFACYQGGVAEVAALTTGKVSVTVAGTGAVSLDPINFRV